MIRKERKTVTKEINDLVVSLMKTGNYSINEITLNGKLFLIRKEAPISGQ